MTKLHLTLAFLFITITSISQNNITELEDSVIIDGLEVIKGTDSFNNLFELKEVHISKDPINLACFSHVYEVTVYNNYTEFKIINNSYYYATNVQRCLENLNPTHNIKFTR